MSATLKASNSADLDYGSGYRPVFLLCGIVLMLCGIFALLAPMISTLAVTLTVGATAVIAGVAQIVHAFRVSAWKGFFLNLLIGLVYLVAGAFFFLWPPQGALAITMLLAWMLLIAGAGEIALGFRVRGDRGWPWLIVSGLIAVLCGIWLLLRIPITGFFVPGIALGIALLFEGAAFVAIGFGRSEGADRWTESETPDGGIAG